MKCLTIRQPWAWLIVNNLKDVENRTWPTPIRGDVLIHAAKGMTPKELENAMDFVFWHDSDRLNALASCKAEVIQQRGHIIGKATLVACVTQHVSPYFVGPFGHVMINSKRCEPFPLTGKLRYFDVTDDVVSQLKWIA